MGELERLLREEVELVQRIDDTGTWDMLPSELKPLLLKRMYIAKEFLSNSEILEKHLYD